jgi:hypothetical protein
LWITVDFANADLSPTVLSNALEIATGVSWLCWHTSRRRDQEARRRTDQDANATISQLRSH